MKQEQTIHMLSLGCPKNRVDSEVMLGHMLDEGYRPVDSPENADVIVVNTCGFIDAAKEESVDAIIEMEEFKKEGSAKKLVVAGCLSQRYAPELAKELPEVVRRMDEEFTVWAKSAKADEQKVLDKYHSAKTKGAKEKE